MVERFLRAATKDRQAADDLSQDIFLKIWTNRAGLGRIRSFKAYLFTMCRNAVYDWLSTHKRAVSLPFGDEILEGLLIGNLQEEMEKEVKEVKMEMEKEGMKMEKEEKKEVREVEKEAKVEMGMEKEEMNLKLKK